MMNSRSIQFKPLTATLWPLFEDLFGEKGGCGGCWCMAYRLSKKEFEENKYAGNKKRLRQLVKKNESVGLLAIYDNGAIGWISMAPREQFARMENSRVHKRIDDEKVWSITCFFIKKEFRNQGLSLQLIEAAKTFARENKIKILEAYPVKPYADKMPDAFAWTGIYSTFIKAGFVVVSEASRSKPMMRWANIDELPVQ
jgi:GNAT superfamily N-acetyltransferase